MNKDRRIVVTGSSGAIGTAVGDNLLVDGENFHGVDRRPNRWNPTLDKRTTMVDLLDPSTIGRLPAEPDIVVHMAANSRVGETVDDPALADENVKTTRVALEYAREANAAFVLASSREVYGETGKQAVTEDHADIEQCENPYGASKLGSEALVRAFESSYGLDACILRFSNVYGRYDAWQRVIPIFIARADAGEDLTVYGTGKTLDFCHIDDAVAGIQAALDRIDIVAGEAINIASGEATDLVDLANQIANLVDPSIGIEVAAERTGEVFEFVADVSKGQRLLGYEPATSLEEGLKLAVEWYTDRPQLLAEIRK